MPSALPSETAASYPFLPGCRMCLGVGYFLFAYSLPTYEHPLRSFNSRGFPQALIKPGG